MDQQGLSIKRTKQIFQGDLIAYIRKKRNKRDHKSTYWQAGGLSLSGVKQKRKHR